LSINVKVIRVTCQIQKPIPFKILPFPINVRTYEYIHETNSSQKAIFRSSPTMTFISSWISLINDGTHDDIFIYALNIVCCIVLSEDGWRTLNTITKGTVTMRVLWKVRHHLGLHPCLTKVVLRVTLDFKNTFCVGLNIAHLEPNMLDKYEIINISSNKC